MKIFKITILWIIMIGLNVAFNHLFNMKYLYPHIGDWSLALSIIFGGILGFPTGKIMYYLIKGEI